MSKKKIPIIDWVKKILANREVTRESLTTVPDADVVTSLIDRAADEETESAKKQTAKKSVSREKTVNSETAIEPEIPEMEEEAKESCPYALRRNIVESLQEIRRFAEEHELATAMIKALLTLLAEMSLDAMKGKVSGKVLLLLLNAINFEKAKKAAYDEGEIAGRNAVIDERACPTDDDGLPRFKGTWNQTPDTKEDIFTIAKS